LTPKFDATTTLALAWSGFLHKLEAWGLLFGKASDLLLHFAVLLTLLVAMEIDVGDLNTTGGLDWWPFTTVVSSLTEFKCSPCFDEKPSESLLLFFI
jgi:hypothetical protein